MMNHRSNAMLSVSALLLAALPVLAGGEKVTVCHIPPGDPDNAQTITVSEHALDAHLGHGDVLGSCDDLCTDAGACDDGDACTSDSCEGSVCVNEPLAADACDDGNDCTDDSCDAASGCVNAYIGDDPDSCAGFYVEVFGDRHAEFFSQDTCNCELDVFVTNSFEFDGGATQGGLDLVSVNECLNTPEFHAELTQALIEIFGSLTTTEPIILTSDDIGVEAIASIVSVTLDIDLLVALFESSLPAGTNSASLAQILNVEHDANPAMADGMAALFMDALLACVGHDNEVSLKQVVIW